ncbi:MAG TPA: hypothetical protein VFD07_09665 [Candidatus Krumholzibacteria bacterium]|nr:hypothetical protein [Candidatus Krumholzibacteria bacterium]
MSRSDRDLVKPDSPDQQRIFATMTHFSPVDLVCSLRDASNPAHQPR